LSPLLDSIYRGTEDDETDSAEMLLKKRMGEELAARLDTEWTSIQCVQAGHWLAGVRVLP
jgi:hypothetical protein